MLAETLFMRVDGLAIYEPLLSKAGIAGLLGALRSEGRYRETGGRNHGVLGPL